VTEGTYRTYKRRIATKLGLTGEKDILKRLLQWIVDPSTGPHVEVQRAIRRSEPPPEPRGMAPAESIEAE
jgi:hypothetical protein